MNNINTILFDLDGTLLSIDMNDFEKIYFGSLIEAMKDFVAPEEFKKILYTSTNAMIQNTEFKTNEEVFMESLESFVKDDFTEYQNRFAKYYLKDFDVLRKAVLSTTVMQEATSLLKEKGYELVIATNPLFPELAINKRIEWAGIDKNEFSYVSYFEKNHYCKPNIEYYEEILKDLGKKPEECMMVGNDVLEDMISGDLGIKTYLITNHMLNRKNIEIKADHIGTYEDFLRFAKDVPSRIN